MKKSRIDFIRWTTIVLVVALIICPLVLSKRWKKAGQTELTLASQPRYATTVDRPRPEIRIEQLLDLDYSSRFDPVLTSLLNLQGDRRQEMAKRNVAGYGQVASVSQALKGGHHQ